MKVFEGPHGTCRRINNEPANQPSEDQVPCNVPTSYSSLNLCRMGVIAFFLESHSIVFSFKETSSSFQGNCCGGFASKNTLACPVYNGYIGSFWLTTNSDSIFGFADNGRTSCHNH